MSEIRGEECGIILCHDFDDLRKGLHSLQHRGRETAGVAVKYRVGSGYKIDVVKWLGKVEDFADHYLGHLLRVNEIHDAIFMGHVRYSTSGKKEYVEKAHPRYTGGVTNNHRTHIVARNVKVAAVHNGTLVNQEDLMKKYDVDSDTDLMVRLYSELGSEGIVRKIPASFSAVIMDSSKQKVSVLRDRHGFRPLSMGERKGRVVAASEDRAIYAMGGAATGELDRGSVEYISERGSDFKKLIEAPQRFCFFEYNYLAHWKSCLNKQNVSNARKRLGFQLGMEFRPDDTTIVTYVPTAPYSISRGYGQAVGIMPIEVFYKITMERSFLGPSQKDRKESIKGNLYVRDDVNLTGQVLVIVDDSTVRANVMMDVAKKCKDRGAKKIYFALATPPLGPVIDNVPRGCLYGVDMPPDDNFIWRKLNGNVEKIKEYTGVDGLHWISEDGMFSAYDMPRENFCSYCIGGPDPLKD